MNGLNVATGVVVVAMLFLAVMVLGKEWAGEENELDSGLTFRQYSIAHWWCLPSLTSGAPWRGQEGLDSHANGSMPGTVPTLPAPAPFLRTTSSLAVRLRGLEVPATGRVPTPPSPQ